MTTLQEKQAKRRAERDQEIVDLANSDPLLLVREIADQMECSMDTVQQVFRRNGINRPLARPKAPTGRPRKQVA